MGAQQNDARLLARNLHQNILHRHSANWRVRGKRISLHGAAIRLQFGFYVLLQLPKRGGPRRTRPETDLLCHLIVGALAVEAPSLVRSGSLVLLRHGGLASHRAHKWRFSRWLRGLVRRIAPQRKQSTTNDPEQGP